MKNGSANNIEEAKKVLEKFLTDMNHWEVTVDQDLMDLIDNDEDTSARDKLAHDDLENIFNRFCIPGKCDRRRLLSLNTGSPATYDIERDSLEFHEQNKDSLIFLYKQDDGWDIYFTMKRYKGEWMIHKAQYFDNEKQKLAGFIL